ncbi:MAG: hypothetical protein WAZ34_12880 [Rhodocyclaceae bacterium]
MHPRTLTIALLLLASPALHAARPFVTDDARLTTAQSCQLESWLRVYAKSSELWALPACNLGGNLEITAGGGRARFDNAPSTSDYVFQAKTLFKPLETNGYGIGLAVGKVLHPEVNPGPNLLGNTYAYIPLTVSFLDDRALVHSNLGWLRDRATRRDNLTWGIGGEFALNGRLSAMAETFGDNRDKPYWQAGLRFFLVPDRVQIDGTFGQQASGPKESRWFSIGLRFTPDRLF